MKVLIFEGNAAIKLSVTLTPGGSAGNLWPQENMDYCLRASFLLLISLRISLSSRLLCPATEVFSSALRNR